VARKILLEHVQGYLELERRFKTKALNISTPLFLAQELLIPNYLSFADYAPDIELRLETRMSLVDFENETLDAAIRFGDGNWPGLDCKKLGDSYISLVCSQNYLATHGPIDINNLTAHRLLSIYPELSDWTALNGKPLAKDQSRIICDSYMATIKSAAEGLGIAVGIFPLVDLWVKNEKLVIPLEKKYNNGNTYWLVSPAREEQTQALEGLHLWVKGLFDTLAD
jgi:LysR family glycine cleavage system transcriptional activator